MNDRTIALPRAPQAGPYTGVDHVDVVPAPPGAQLLIRTRDDDGKPVVLAIALTDRGHTTRLFDAVPALLAAADTMRGDVADEPDLAHPAAVADAVDLFTARRVAAARHPAVRP